MNNSYEQQQIDLVAERDALKCQASELRAALVMFFNGGWDDEHTEAINDQVKSVILKTPEQCVNSIKADAIEEMCDKMPSSGFTKMRDQSNWICDYFHDLRSSNKP
jgi:hypothetical protein